MLTHCIRQGLRAILQLHSGLQRGKKDQIGMAESMIAEHVSGPSQFAYDIRPPIHVAPDEKKCCPDIVSGKNFQQTKSVRIVGTIVISQRQLLGSRLQPSERPAIPLPGWGHRLVAGNNGRCHNTSPEGEATHSAAIVNRFSVPLRLCGENRGYSSLNCARRSAGISCHAKP